MGGGPPAFPPDSSCPVVLRILAMSPAFRLREFHPLRSVFPNCSTMLASTFASPYPVRPKTNGLGSFHFARRYFENRCFFLFLRLLRCFSSPGSLRYTMYSCNGDGALPPPGFPIRISMDISLVCSSPWLFAAYHVLLRLLVPRHPPYALISLIVFLSFSLEYRLS